MARYTGPMTRKSRRLKVDLVGGDQAFERRPYPPGQHGRIRIKETEYLLQMQEKQKARFAYGVLERQFRRYYEEANRRQGKTGDNLLQILESRLDNVVYRAGLARTRRMARQLVNHGHFLVNGKKVEHPELPGLAVRHHRRQASRWRPTRSSWPRSCRRPADPGLAAGRAQHPAHPRPPAAGAGADRHAGHRAADRRALLQVNRLPGSEFGSPRPCSGPPPGHHCGIK